MFKKQGRNIDKLEDSEEWITELFQNPDLASYKKVLESGGQKLSQFLTVEEEAVIKYYTTNAGYKKFNQALRGEIDMTSEFAYQEKLLTQALEKLPNFANQDELWRGIKNVDLQEIKRIYKKDAVITETSFLSTAYNIDDFVRSSRERDFTIIFKIKGKNGKLIESVSALPEEAEVLFKRGAKFRVKNAGNDIHPDPKYEGPNGVPWIWTIIMEEL